MLTKTKKKNLILCIIVFIIICCINIIILQCTVVLAEEATFKDTSIENNKDVLKERLDQQNRIQTAIDEQIKIMPQYLRPETFSDGEVNFFNFKVIIPPEWYAMTPTEDSVVFSSDKFEEPLANIIVTRVNKTENFDAYNLAESINLEYGNTGEIIQVEYNDILFYKVSVADKHTYLTTDVDTDTCVEIAFIMIDFIDAEEFMDYIMIE